MFEICFDIWPYIINFSTAGCVFIMDEFIYSKSRDDESLFKNIHDMMKETKCPFLDHIFDSFFIYSHIHLVVMYGVVPHWISTNLMGTKLGKFSISKSLRELRSERKSPTAKKMIFLPLLLPLTTFPVYCVDHLQILFFILLSSLTSCSIEFNYLIFPLINDKIFFFFFVLLERIFFAYIRMTFAIFIK